MVLALAVVAQSAIPAWADPPSAVDVVQALDEATTGAISKAEGCVVSISRMPDATAIPPTFGPFGNRAAPEQPDWKEYFGTGVVLTDPADSESRLVLTNRHVVVPRSSARTKGRKPGRLIVVLPGKRQVDAEIVAADPRSDLAVLSLDLRSRGIVPADIPTLELGEAEKFRKGQMVVLLGNPYAVARDGSASVSLATIANVSRSPWNGVRKPLGDEELTVHHLGTLWHLDSRINLVASGGAVVDFNGKLIGLTTSLAALEGYESSVGYAIPMNAGFRRIVDSLLRGYEVEYGFLGLAPRTTTHRGLFSDRERPNGSIVEVLGVAAGSPADAAGIQAGDFITAVNGVPIRGDDDLIREIGLLGPDAIAKVEVRRLRGTMLGLMVVNVRLGKWPVYDDSSIVATKTRRPDWRGLQVDYATARRRYLSSELFDRYSAGVVIRSVAPGSPAEAAGLREGQFISRVNDSAISTPSGFAEAVETLKGPVSLQLDNGQSVTIGE
jgi:serine protease Do